MLFKLNLYAKKYINRFSKIFLILLFLIAMWESTLAQGPGGGGLDNPTEGGGPGGDLGGDPDLVPISGLEYLLAGAVMYGARKAYKQKKNNKS